MGGVLQSCAWICAVPEHGTRHRRYLSHTVRNIACLGWHCNRGPMDDRVSHGYPFHNAFMTESSGVDDGAIATALLGMGGRNQLEARKVAWISRLGAARRRRPLHRIAWRNGYARRFGARRRDTRRTQIADAV